MAKRTTKGYGTIYYREDRKKYCAQVIIGINPDTGKYIRKTLYHEDHKELVKQKKALEAKVQLGLYGVSKNYTVASWLDEWLKAIKVSKEPSTYESYESICRVHLKPALGTIALDKLTNMQIQKLVNEKFSPADGSKGLSKRTTRYIRQTLYKALEKAKAQNLIISNPAASIELAEDKETSPRNKAFSAEEMQIFLKRTEETPYYYIWFIAFMTGFRRGEILGLQWQDINYENNSISLLRQVYFDNGKVIIKPKLKTPGASTKVVVMPLVVEAIKEYRSLRRSFFAQIGLSMNDSDLIFCHPDGSPLRPDTVTAAFKKAVVKFGLRKELTLHSTRHTFATISSDIDINLKKLQQLLRHEELTMTSSYIDKSKDEAMKREISKINEAFSSLLNPKKTD
jgi:integrase